MFGSTKKRSNNRRRGGGYFLQKFLKIKTDIDVDDQSSSLSPTYTSLIALQVESVDDDKRQWFGDDLRRSLRPNGPCHYSASPSPTVVDERSTATKKTSNALGQLDSRKFINVDKLRADAGVEALRNSCSNKGALTSCQRLLPTSINDEPSSSSPNRAYDTYASSTSSMTARLRSSSSPTYLRNASCSTAAAHNRTPSLLINQLITHQASTASPPTPTELVDRSKCYSPASRACRFTLLFDPAGSFCYYWSLVVSVAFLYNLWVIIYRYTFDEINPSTLIRWFCLDYSCDLIYTLDIVMQFRTGYLDEGVLQTNPTKLRIHYVNTTRFYLDCLSLLPLDFLYLSIGFRSILRSFRLVKMYKFWSFVEKTERHTNNPNVLRSILLFHSILLIFHWNACLIYAFRSYLNYSAQPWDKEDHFYNYLHAFYLSCRTLMLIESLPMPQKGLRYGYMFIIFQQVCGLIMLATVLGHVAGIVANVSAGRKHFQAQLDSVKTYMRLRKVPNHLQRKVIRWFDYWWSSKKYGNDKEVLECLPDKLKAEIAIHVHLDTLKRVEIFQNTEPGFLCELVIRLKPMLFSPGDYICRKGEVGKEMYIVNRGKLQVLADDGNVVLATLKAGSYFGEISILNMGTEGNRRTASVVSVGYSDLFCLTKKEIWEVLEDYPAARARLELIANKRLRQKAQKLSTIIPRERLIESNESQGLPTLVETFNTATRRRRSAPASLLFTLKTNYLSDNSKNRRSESKAILNKLISSPLKHGQIEVASSASAAYTSNASTLYDVEDNLLDDGKRSDRAQLLSRTTPSKTRSSSKDFKNQALSVDTPSPCYDTPPMNSGETIRLTLYDDAQDDSII